MAPPLRKGSALVAQRALGLVFLLVLALAVALAIGLYRKSFTPVTTVVLEADRAGNQLTVGADVKARGVVVGDVRRITRAPGGARLELALQPEAARRLPSDVTARLLPKTLFGEKFVALEPDLGSSARPLREGDVIAADRSQTARETSEALDALHPLLLELRPDRLSVTLNAVSSALRGRGERIGQNAVLVEGYLRELNPEIPALGRANAGLADFADTLTAATPDVVRVLDDSAALSRSLVRDRDALSTFLTSTAGFADEARRFLRENERRLVQLPAESLPSLRVYQRYAPQYPCLLAGINGIQAEGERVFGGAQPGLHITLEFTERRSGYLPGDEPEYGEDSGPTCFGLPPNPPVRPFPIYKEVQDGYCDEEEQAGEEVLTECPGRDPQPPASASEALAAMLVGPVAGGPSPPGPAAVASSRGRR